MILCQLGPYHIMGSYWMTDRNKTEMYVADTAQNVYPFYVYIPHPFIFILCAS